MTEFARMIFATNAVMLATLRHGQLGYETDTGRFVIRDMAGVHHYFFAPGATDHGALLGLLDNDHPQYVNAVGDTASVDLTLAGQSISGVVLPAGVDHALLANLNSANYTHLTAVNHTDLTDGGLTTLHAHSKLVASDGAPDPAFSADATGNMTAVARVIVDDTTDATTTTDGSLQTDGGLSVVKAAVIGGLLTTAGGRIKNTTTVLFAASPYTILATDHEIFCDTDGGAITVNLPAGIDGANYIVHNAGTSGNNVTINPNGAELLMGENTAYILLNGEYIDITYSG